MGIREVPVMRVNGRVPGQKFKVGDVVAYVTEDEQFAIGRIDDHAVWYPDNIYRVSGRHWFLEEALAPRIGDSANH